jgi:hypothetical protein
MFDRLRNHFNEMSPMGQGYLFAGGLIGTFTVGVVGLGMGFELAQEHPVDSVVALLGGVAVAKIYKFHREPHVRSGLQALNGSHDQYDDPLDSRLFYEYCKQVTDDIVWAESKIEGSGSSDKLSVE